MSGLFSRLLSLQSLTSAYARVKQNGGCAGGDGVSLAEFDATATARLEALRASLVGGQYRPGPLRQILIPKPDGGTRPLTIPSIIDRVAQTAVARLISAALEPEFSDNSFGYRPGRSVQRAVDRIAAWRGRGYGHVVEADIERFFETIPHDPLLSALEARFPGDPHLTALIALWVEQAGLALDSPGMGLAQGSPLSPVLANFYLDPLDDLFAGPVVILRYADDFLLLARTEEAAADALDVARGFLAGRGLRLVAQETRLTSFRRGFRFLGHLFVRSTVLKEAGTPDPGLDALLVRIAREDAARQDEDEAVRAETAAGYDRGQRVLYMLEPGRRLAVDESGALSVQGAEGQPMLRLSPGRVHRIEMAPDVETDLSTLRHLLAHGIGLALTDGRGETAGWLTPAGADSAALHLAQARVMLDERLRADLARRIVEGRLRNMRARLQVLNRDDKDPFVAEAASGIGITLRRLVKAQTPEEARGYEGAAAALYWPALGVLSGEGKGFRRERPAKTPLNAALNFLAALLERDVRAAVLSVGLHPGFGVLHAPADRHAACVWDLMEGFRALLAEAPAVALARKGALEVTPGEGGAPSARLTGECQRRLIRAYETALDRITRSRHSGQRHAFRIILRQEARAFAAHCRAPEKAPFTVQVQDV